MVCGFAHLARASIQARLGTLIAPGPAAHPTLMLALSVLSCSPR